MRTLPVLFALLSIAGCSIAACSSDRPDFHNSDNTGGGVGDSGGDGDGSMGGTTDEGDGDGDTSSTSGDGGTTGEGETDEETDACTDHECKNGASCKADGDEYYTCKCDDGFSGPKCEVDIDDCADSPCENGGACKDGVDSYSCDCAGTGYEGTSCDAALVQQLALPPEASSCEVVGLSDGGTVIAANCQTGGDSFGDPYFWRADQGWIALERASGYAVGWLVGLSADGSTAVGDFRDNGPDYAGVWTSATAAASILSNAEWSSPSAISASGNAVIASDPGGSLLRWMPLTASDRESWGTGSGSHGVAMSGDGKVLVAGGTGPYHSDGGYRVCTSTTACEEVILTDEVSPRFASQDGSTFVYLYDGKDADVVRNGQTAYHSDCAPAGLSSDGRRMLAMCSGILRLFRDGTGVDVQTLIDDSGVGYTLPPFSTENSYQFPVRMSWDGEYIAVAGASKVVLIHLQE